MRFQSEIRLKAASRSEEMKHQFGLVHHHGLVELADVCLLCLIHDGV